MATTGNPKYNFRAALVLGIIQVICAAANLIVEIPILVEDLYGIAKGSLGFWTAVFVRGQRKCDPGIKITVKPIVFSWRRDQTCINFYSYFYVIIHYLIPAYICINIDKYMSVLCIYAHMHACILDSPVGLSVGIHFAGDSVPETLGSNPALSRGRQCVSFVFEKRLPVAENRNQQQETYMYTSECICWFTCAHCMLSVCF